MGTIEMTEAYEGYDVMDGCYATVVDRCQKGVFLELDNGQAAFAYHFTGVYPGTQVLCTVLKRASEGKRILVSVDSVTRYASRAA